MIPLVVEALKDIALYTASAKGFEAVNNYINKTPSQSSPVTFPSSRSKSSVVSPKTAKKQSLSAMSDGIVAGLALTAGVVGSYVKPSITSIKDSSTEKKASNDSLKAPVAPSSGGLPNHLFNQLELKQSVDDLVTAINSQTIAGVAVLGTLDANLSAISATLVAISDTLLDISDNYSSEINNTGDLPYMDTETFYDLLEESGASVSEIANWKAGEMNIIDSASASGFTYPEIKQAVLAYRSGVIPSNYLLRVGNSVAGVTTSSPVDANGNPVSSDLPDFQPVLDWATSAKVREDFLQKPLEVKDLDGETVAVSSPMELQVIKHASDARHKTDINNETFDDTDNPFGSLDLMPLLNFVGRADTFDKNKVLSNLFKPEGV